MKSNATAKSKSERFDGTGVYYTILDLIDGYAIEDDDWAEDARRFLSGDFKPQELKEIGTQNIYDIATHLFRKLNVYKFLSEYLGDLLAENEDALSILMARRNGINVKICGEGADVARESWEEAKQDSVNVQQVIDKLKKRASSIGEEIYLTLKRGERRAAQAGAVALEQFNATKDAALKLGAPDMKQAQRERAAQWLIDENAAGRKTSIVDAALHFGNEIEAEKIKGGYEDVESLKSALYKFADHLGINQYKDRKRGRPRKQ